MAFEPLNLIKFGTTALNLKKFENILSIYLSFVVFKLESILAIAIIE